MTSIHDASKVRKLLKKRKKLVSKLRQVEQIDPQRLVLKGCPKEEGGDPPRVRGEQRSGGWAVWTFTEALAVRSVPSVGLKANDTVKAFFVQYLMDQIGDVDVALSDLGFHFPEAEAAE